MRSRTAAMVLLSLLSSCAFAASGSDVVWRIGKFDRSSAEFAQGSPTEPVSYVTGEAQPAKDWYAYAPSFYPGSQPNNASAPRAIVFSISGSRARAWRLIVSIMIDHRSVPALRVSINGRSGLFYLHPRLDYEMGDMVAAFYPAYSHARVEVDFPGGWLQSGRNTITLQAVGTGGHGVPDAGFNYDAIELDRSSSAPAPATALMEPTIFYQQHGTALDERVNVFLRFDQRLRTGHADLEVSGHRFSQPLRADQDFGEERLSFLIPEFAANTPAHLALKFNGRRMRFTQNLTPGKKWRLFLVPLVHLDIGYSDYQAKISAIQSRILDEAMDLAAKHPGFCFSTDGEWNLQQFLASRTPAEKQRLSEAIRSHQIFVPAEFANLLTGFPAAETLIRSLYPSADFSRLYHTPFNYANITDVPSYSWSYASILAAAGIRDFVAAANNDRAPVLLEGHLNENSPFWWEGPDGGKVLFWYSRHYEQMQFLFGLPPILETGEELLPLFLQMYEHPSYRASEVIVYGTQVENTDLFPQQAELADEWNAHFAYPRIEYSGFHRALESIAQQFGPDIPTVRGDGGPYWEDGIGSDAFYAALERVNEARAPSAEKLATISSLVNPRLAVDRDELDRMWTNMVLMDEHTWTSWNSVSDPNSSEAVDQLRVKHGYATAAAELRQELARRSMASIADSIAAGPGSLIVFNPLDWTRDGRVTADLDHGMEIVDRAAGKVVPFDVLEEGNDFRKVEFVATGVPAVGYKVYSLRSAPAAETAPETASATVLESPYYRVELDPASGAIRSIYDKQLDRELVDQHSPWRFGQYLYVTGGDREPNTILQYRAVSPRPALEIHPAEHGRLVSVERTQWGWRARLESSDLNTPEIRTEILLFAHEKKIEVIENIDKKAELKKEAVYFAFPFAMSHPQFQYEIQNGVVDPAEDMYPGAGHEWFSVQHWVSVQQDGVSAAVMPLDASLVTLGDINRGAWPTEFGQRPGVIFSYVMNNYWHTNYRAEQGGHLRFRYVITSAAETDPAALSRMGWEEVTPFEKDEIQSQDKALDLPQPLNGNQGSFLTVDDPDLLLETWKPAEDGNGTILRFLDLGGAARTVTVSTPLLKIDRVTETDAVERNEKPLDPDGPHSFRFAVRPHQIVTVRVVGTPVLHPRIE